MDQPLRRPNAKGQFVLPRPPVFISPELAILVQQYLDGFHAQSEDGLVIWEGAAAAVQEYEPRSVADVAAKLILSIHYHDPEYVGEELAVDAHDAPADRQSIEMILSCVDWLIAAADAVKQPERGDWDSAMAAFRAIEAEYAVAGPAYDAKVVTSRAEDEAIDQMLDRLCDARFALIKMPAPDMAALGWKLEHLLHAEDNGVQPWSKDVVAETNADIRRLLQPAASQHMGWLAARNEARDQIDASVAPDDDDDQHAARINELDARILAVPAASKDDAFAKLLLAVQLAAEGHDLADGQAAALAGEAQRFVNAGRPAAVGE